MNTLQAKTTLSTENPRDLEFNLKRLTLENKALMEQWVAKSISFNELGHKINWRVALQCWLSKDTSHAVNWLNVALADKGQTRVESIAYWFTNIAGIISKYDSKSGKFVCTFAVNKKGVHHTSELDIPFTYDKAHLELCKQHNFKDIAPVKIKDLTIKGDIKALSGGFANSIALAILSNQLTMDQVREFINSGGLDSEVRTALKKESNINKACQYLAIQDSPSDNGIDLSQI